MAKKQMSFAEKAAKHKNKDLKTVKYVKSEKSEKSGNWRFNENFIQLAANENLDQALARMEQEVKELAKEMASIEDISSEKESKVEEVVEEVKAETKEKVEEVKAEATKEEAKPEEVVDPSVKAEVEDTEKVTTEA